MQIWQDKAHDPDKNTEVAEPIYKSTTNAAETTHIPAWANAGGERVPAGLQAKLTVNQPGDVYEQEADRVAEQVMRMPADQVTRGAQVAGSPGPASVQRQVLPAEEPRNKQEVGEVGGGEADEEAPEEAEGTSEGEADEEEAIQAKEVQGQTPRVTPQLQTQIGTMKGSGQALPASTRAFMEPRFGYDFGQVRVHTDEQATQSAESMNALAYTSGRDIAFGPGQYKPETTAGQQLLAHELTHVIQQQKQAPGTLPVQRKIKLLTGTWPFRKWVEITQQHYKRFVRRYFPENQWHIVMLIFDEMASSRDDFEFDDVNELYREVFKRMRTSQLMTEAQKEYKTFGAFGYPEKGHDGQVNLAARQYWGPVQHDAKGNYCFELSSAGKENAFEAITKLFVPQHLKKNRTLIHCDYLASVIHMRVFAETIGAKEFNKRVKEGTIPLKLKWNGFDDIKESTWRSSKQESLREVQPSSEKDLVIGDHVVFWNHRAYDLINARVYEAWRLENAIVEDQQGGELIFEGHGSGKRTNRGMRTELMKRYNEVVKMAKDMIEAHLPQLSSKFPFVKFVAGKWRIRGHNDFIDKDIDIELKPTYVDDPELIGLRNPKDPSQMNVVRRPIESE